MRRTTIETRPIPLLTRTHDERGPPGGDFWVESGVFETPPVRKLAGAACERTAPGGLEAGRGDLRQATDE